ncbi:hypothetical protein BU038_11775 [Staphylococcus simulans]|nr:hypothetical protein BU038_11775 [Staphylococcus simulans]
MTKFYTYSLKGYLLPFTTIFFMIFILILTSYSYQYSLKLKTIHNLNIYYKQQLEQIVEKDDKYEKQGS